MDLSLNFQKLRHSLPANLLRRLVYSWIVGDDDWPPAFQAPASSSCAHEPSRNVYVHLPFCTTICPHCPYNAMRFDAELSSRYRNALLREIAAYVSGDNAVPVESLYIGGGTPSLTPESVAAVIDAFGALLTDSAEIAIETYPTHATPARLENFKGMGINRLSLGIETLDPRLLKKLGRRYSPEQALEAIRASTAAGFDLVDTNLIFGIPGQATDIFLEGVRECLAHGVDQVSAYPLFTFDHTAAGQPGKEQRYARAGDRQRLRMQRGVARLCLQSGFERTSVWSFTRRGVSPYTTVTRPDYIGFGAGAGSKSAHRAAFNTFSVPAYIDAAPNAVALEHKLTHRQQRADWLYWQLYNARVDRPGYVERFGHGIEHDFGNLLRILRALGYLEHDQASYTVTERGAIWIHRLQSLFSLNGIDAVWSKCRSTAWPDDVRVA
jgi:oxygen-independent coproporphyrinogen-3 oxidase